MAELIYTAITSLDGFVTDERGEIDWGEPDEEVHEFINDLERSIGTHLYGRRMYEVMAAWETLELSDQPHFMRDFAELWRAAEKIVYSKTLGSVANARTRIERDVDPQAIKAMKASEDRDLTIGGADLAAHAFRAGLVDECRLFLMPVAVGGGKRALPPHARLDLQLLDEHRFRSGVVYVRYRIA